MKPGVAAIGLCSWDQFIVTDVYPGRGEYAIVRHRFEQAGGTTGNTCAALARLGVDVTLVSRVGSDLTGQRLIESLDSAGCDTRYIERVPDGVSDSGIIVISGPHGHRDRTIYWIQGVKPISGMTFPVDEMLANTWVMIDIDDARLRSFFLDLPAHRSPRTKLFGTMTYLVEMPSTEGWAHVLRHDVVAGNVRELLALTAAADLDSALQIAQEGIRHSACRAMFVSNGPSGGIAVDASDIHFQPACDVEVIDTTGAGDAFAAGCLWGLLEHEDPAGILVRANVLGGLACRALGARASLPTLDEALTMMKASRPSP